MNRKMKLYVVDGGGDNSVVMLSANTLNALGLFRGDIVIVSNTANGRDTALIALADGTYDDQNVGLPLVARTNLGVDLGRPVELTELTTVQYATRITVLPVEGSPLPQGCNVFDTFLRPYFTDSYRPVREGDYFTIQHQRSFVEFQITATDPSPYCIVAADTIIHCEGAPVRKRKQ